MRYPEIRICFTKVGKFLFSVPLVFALSFSASVQAHLPEPAVTIDMVATDSIRHVTRTDRTYPKLNLFSHIVVEESDPISSERVDVYIGFIRPDGVPMTWADDLPYQGMLPAVGMFPIARNFPLSGGGFGLPMNGGYLQYLFKPEDLPGIYQWFTLLVRSGKSVEDPTQWVTLRTKMLPVK